MKRILYLVMAALMVVAVSCKKDDHADKVKYGVDGVTPMPEAVDMGTAIDGKEFKWASFNLGASTTLGYGDYYSWGELEPKDVYRADNYTYADHPIELPLSLDPANKKLGKNWRLPTKEEFDMLLNICQTVDVTLADGVKGISFISKKTGNSLFFPLAGSMNGASKESLGALTTYLSSTSMEQYQENVWGLSVYPKSAGFSYLAIVQSASRARGNPIRPVYED